MFRTVKKYEEDELELPYPVGLIDRAEEEINASGVIAGVSVPDLKCLAAAMAMNTLPCRVGKIASNSRAHGPKSRCITS